MHPQGSGDDGVEGVHGSGVVLGTGDTEANVDFECLVALGELLDADGILFCEATSLTRGELG